MSVHWIRAVDDKAWNLISLHLHNSWKGKEDVLNIAQIYVIQDCPLSGMCLVTRCSIWYNNRVKNCLAWDESSLDNHKEHGLRAHQIIIRSTV